MHLDTTMELAAIRQREIQHGEFRRTAGRRAPGHRARPHVALDVALATPSRSRTDPVVAFVGRPRRLPEWGP